MLRFLHHSLIAATLLAAAHACPGCKIAPTDAVVPPQAIQRQIQATNSYAWSVLFLLGVPMTLLGGVGLFVVKTCRDLDQAKANKA